MAKDRRGTADAKGVIVIPRRKYGRLTRPVPPTPKEKCPQCLLGRPCPIHGTTGGVAPDLRQGGQAPQKPGKRKRGPKQRFK